jgi:tetratricopeptide (TPR) repeat protein
MPKLKPISEESIPKALIRAKHYRLLNEPWQAESICRDILQVDPDHQRALLYLILAITDQFGLEKRSSDTEAKRLCKQLTSPYEQKYYRGIIEERLGKISLKRTTPRVKYIAFEHYYRAMEYFEEAEKLRPKGNEDSVLRYNACARSIKQFKLEPSPDDNGVQPFLDM